LGWTQGKIRNQSEEGSLGSKERVGELTGISFIGEVLKEKAGEIKSAV